jgi:hypothetical protein
LRQAIEQLDEFDLLPTIKKASIKAKTGELTDSLFSVEKNEFNIDEVENFQSVQPLQKENNNTEVYNKQQELFCPNVKCSGRHAIDAKGCPHCGTSLYCKAINSEGITCNRLYAPKSLFCDFCLTRIIYPKLIIAEEE